MPEVILAGARLKSSVSWGTNQKLAAVMAVARPRPEGF